MKTLIRWIFWRCFEEYIGGTPNRSDFPNVGEVFLSSCDNYAYLITRVKSDNRPYYTIYGIPLGVARCAFDTLAPGEGYCCIADPCTYSLPLKHGEADTVPTLAEEKESLFSKESDKLFEHAPTPKEAEDFE